jgi:hypothetical protein
MIDINFYENQKKFDDNSSPVSKKDIDNKINIKLNINSEVTNNNIRINEKEERVVLIKNRL